MKNKLIFTTLCYIIGVILAYTELLSIAALIIIFPLIFLIILMTVKNREKLVYYLIIVCLSIIIGFFIAKNNLNIILDDYYDEIITVEGKIIEKELDNQIFIVDIEKLISNDSIIQKVDEKIIFNFTESIEELKVGSVIKVKGRFLEPLNSKNRFIFDYKEYLFRNNIQGVMFLEREDVEILKRENILYMIRENVLNKSEIFINENLYKENGDILKSVLYGDTDYLDKSFLTGIRNTGVAHVFAVSGLHIGIFIVVFSYIFKFLKLNIRKSQVVTSIFLWFYAYIIGFPVSILRALILFSIITLGNLLYRKNSPFNSISFAGLVLLIYNPLWIFDVGFQLSFSTTITIYFYLNYIYPKIQNKLLNKLIFIPFVQLGILPILSYYFNYISLFSYIGNLILVPIFSIILSISIVGVMLSFIILPIAEFIFYFVNFGLGFFRYILENIFEMKYLGILVASPDITEIFLYYGLFLYIIFLFNLKFYGVIHKFIIASIFVFTLYYGFIPTLSDSLEIAFLDVGQANASYIKYKDKNLFIDLGGDVYATYNKGEKELPEYIKKRGIFEIDMLFISHIHEDHYSSIESVNKVSNIKNIFIYKKSKNIPVENNTNIIEIEKGNKIVLDEDLYIDVLWPENGFYSTDENENSLVLMINYKDNKVLYTGDINKNIERKILSSINDVDILLVPHHGSSTSSGEDFISKLRPDISVFSYGKNFYGIPALEVVERYNNYGSQIHSTFKDGEIWAIMDNDGYSISTKDNQVKDKIKIYEILTGIMILYMFLSYLAEGDLYNEEIERL
ncbi:MAG: DNA internalization-related competence protein ComEC/Rec2 [Bacillota bacterium]|nr:DNA internalization-related competence protein ComEC/Rec2 [Bacillota bacterium]